LDSLLRENHLYRRQHPSDRAGDNAAVGNGSLMVKDVPADCLAVGKPAKVIRQITAEDRT